MTEIMRLIEAHTSIVNAIDNSSVKITADQLLGLMVISHKIAGEGAEIVRIARKSGIDCKIDMQSGRIIL